MTDEVRKIAKGLFGKHATTLHLKQHYVFRLTQPLFIIIISNTTCFDQADHYQVFVYTKT